MPTAMEAIVVARCRSSGRREPGAPAGRSPAAAGHRQLHRRLGDIPQFDRCTSHADTTSPVSFRPIKVRNRPIPTAKLALSDMRNRFGQPAAYLEKCQQDKEAAGNKNRSQSHLPAVPHDLDHHEGDKGIFTHVGGNGKRPFCPESHDDRAEDRCEDGGRYLWSPGNPGIFQNGRIDDDDIRHGQESGDAGRRFPAGRRCGILQIRRNAACRPRPL